MKSVAAWVFVLLYGVALLRPIFPLVEYYANQDYFAEVLCVNKEKPELACKGQCMLMQKLKKASEEPASPTPNVPNGKVNLKDYPPIGFVSFLKKEFMYGKSDVPRAGDGYVDRWPTEVIFQIFHPPA